MPHPKVTQQELVTYTTEPLHPKRLEHPLEKALRMLWTELREARQDEVLAGPECRFNEVPEGADYKLNTVTGGYQPFPYGRMTPRDRMIAAEVLQWLGSPVGFSRLVMAFDRAGGSVKFDDYRRGQPPRGADLTADIPDPADVGTPEYRAVHQLVGDADTLGDAVHSLEELICYTADARAQLTKHDPSAAGMPRRRIVSAAMRNDKTGRIVMCVRHRDELFRASLLPGEVPRDYDDGFVDNRRQFLTREEAWPIAAKSGQIIRRCGGDGKVLFSENIC